MNVFQKIAYLLTLPEKKEKEFRAMHDKIAFLENLIRDRTEIHADIHMYGESLVFVVGRYRNTDYVRLFSIDARSFTSVIELMENLVRQGRIGRIDQPYGMPDISAVIDRKKWS